MNLNELESGVFEAGMICTKVIDQTMAALKNLSNHLAENSGIELIEFNMARVSAGIITRRRFRCKPFKYNNYSFMVVCDIVISEDSEFGQLLHSPFVAWQILQAKQERTLGEDYSYEILPHNEPKEEHYTVGDWEMLPNQKNCYIFRGYESNSTRAVFYTRWASLLNEFGANKQGAFSLIADVLYKLTCEKFYAASLKAEGVLIPFIWDNEQETLLPKVDGIEAKESAFA